MKKMMEWIHERNINSVDLIAAEIKRFSDGEVWVEIQENVRGQDVFVLQSTSYPANDHLMELLITVDALKSRLARFLARTTPPTSGETIVTFSRLGNVC
jgi:phosphoribosylpyrophosphate synthetase